MSSTEDTKHRPRCNIEAASTKAMASDDDDDDDCSGRWLTGDEADNMFKTSESLETMKRANRAIDDSWRAFKRDLATRKMEDFRTANARCTPAPPQAIIGHETYSTPCSQPHYIQKSPLHSLASSADAARDSPYTASDGLSESKAACQFQHATSIGSVPHDSRFAGFSKGVKRSNGDEQLKDLKSTGEARMSYSMHTPGSHDADTEDRLGMLKIATMSPTQVRGASSAPGGVSEIRQPSSASSLGLPHICKPAPQQKLRTLESRMGQSIRRPGGLGAGADDRRAIQQSENLSIFSSQSGPTGQDLPTLPEGWSLIPGGGNLGWRYVNIKTSECQWELPTALAANSDEVATSPFFFAPSKTQRPSADGLDVIINEEDASGYDVPPVLPAEHLRPQQRSQQRRALSSLASAGAGESLTNSSNPTVRAGRSSSSGPAPFPPAAFSQPPQRPQSPASRERHKDRLAAIAPFPVEDDDAQGRSMNARFGNLVKEQNSMPFPSNFHPQVAQSTQLPEVPSSAYPVAETVPNLTAQQSSSDCLDSVFEAENPHHTPPQLWRSHPLASQQPQPFQNRDRNAGEHSTGYSNLGSAERLAHCRETGEFMEESSNQSSIYAGHRQPPSGLQVPRNSPQLHQQPVIHASSPAATLPKRESEIAPAQKPDAGITAMKYDRPLHKAPEKDPFEGLTAKTFSNPGGGKIRLRGTYTETPKSPTSLVLPKELFDKTSNESRPQASRSYNSYDLPSSAIQQDFPSKGPNGRVSDDVVPRKLSHTPPTSKFPPQQPLPSMSHNLLAYDEFLRPRLVANDELGRSTTPPEDFYLQAARSATEPRHAASLSEGSRPTTHPATSAELQKPRPEIPIGRVRSISSFFNENASTATRLTVQEEEVPVIYPRLPSVSETSHQSSLDLISGLPADCQSPSEPHDKDSHPALPKTILRMERGLASTIPTAYKLQPVSVRVREQVARLDRPRSIWKKGSHESLRRVSQEHSRQLSIGGENRHRDSRSPISEQLADSRGKAITNAEFIASRTPLRAGPISITAKTLGDNASEEDQMQTDTKLSYMKHSDVEESRSHQAVIHHAAATIDAKDSVATVGHENSVIAHETVTMGLSDECRGVNEHSKKRFEPEPDPGILSIALGEIGKAFQSGKSKEQDK